MQNVKKSSPLVSHDLDRTPDSKWHMFPDVAIKHAFTHFEFSTSHGTPRELQVDKSKFLGLIRNRKMMRLRGQSMIVDFGVLILQIDSLSRRI